MASKAKAGTEIIEILEENRQLLENWAKVVTRWGSVEALAEYQKHTWSFPTTTFESAVAWNKDVAEKLIVLIEKLDLVKLQSRPATKRKSYYKTWYLYIQNDKSPTKTAKKLGLFHSDQTPNTKEIRDRLKIIWEEMKAAYPEHNFSSNYLIDMKLEGESEILNATFKHLETHLERSLDSLD